MHSKHFLVVVVLAGFVSACGSGKPAGGAAGHAGQAANASGNASAVQVALEARGHVTCPAKVNTPTAPGAPVDDVVGVRPGMTYEEAAGVVLCSDPLLVVTPETSRGFQIKTYGHKIRQGFNARTAVARVAKSSRQIVREMERHAMDRGLNAVQHDMQPGQTKWFVSTMGMPGRERVISAAREQWFAAGRNPTLASVEKALLDKYGAAATQSETSPGYWHARWIYGPDGHLAAKGSPLSNRCSGVDDPDSGMNLSPVCGVIIEAMIRGRRDNRALAESMDVGVIDQAGGYASLTATEKGLADIDARRRALQVKNAAQDAQAPQL